MRSQLIVASIVAVAFTLLTASWCPARAEGFYRPGYTTNKRARLKRKTDKGFTNSIMGAKDKLAGGVKNILGAPMEMAVSVDQGYQRRRRAGALSGFVEGFSRFARRLGSGVVDVVTFPTRFPNNSYRNGMPPKGPVKMYRDHRKQRSFSTRGS